MSAVALAVAACQAWFSICFTSLDEVGYLPLDRTEANMAFQLVPNRHIRSYPDLSKSRSGRPDSPSRIARFHLQRAREAQRLRRSSLSGKAVESPK